jgi:hypothetical protein
LASLSAIVKLADVSRAGLGGLRPGAVGIIEPIQLAYQLIDVPVGTPAAAVACQHAARIDAQRQDGESDLSSL